MTADPELPNELVVASRALSSAGALAYLIASSVPVPMSEGQEILELDSVAAKLGHHWVRSSTNQRCIR